MLFKTFVEETWRPSCARLRECTRVGYESTLRCHILPKWGDSDMDAITAPQLEAWLNSFQKAGAARKAWAVFRAILRLAFRKGATDNDVTRREIRLPRPRLHRELPLVGPPAVDRRDTIHHKTADSELRIGGDLREMDWGYGKLFCKPDAQPQIMMAFYQSAKKVHGAVWMHQYRRNVSGVADSGHDRVFA